MMPDLRPPFVLLDFDPSSAELEVISFTVIKPTIPIPNDPTTIKLDGVLKDGEGEVGANTSVSGDDDKLGIFGT